MDKLPVILKFVVGLKTNLLNMTHWLEDAEKHHTPEGDSLSGNERFNLKYQKIQLNYAQYQKQYDAFIGEMHGLILRVNNLPVNQRVPFSKMEGREKESRLKNKLNIFSSSQRINKSGFFGFLPFVKTHHFKHIRVVFITISDKPGMIDLEMKENILIREPIRKEKSIQQGKSDKHSKFHVIYCFPIEKLNEQVGLEIIDWLAFRKAVNDCLFFTVIPGNQKHYI